MFGVEGKLVKNKRKCQEGKTRRSEIHVINVRCGKLGKIYHSGFGDGIQQLCGASAGIKLQSRQEFVLMTEPAVVAYLSDSSAMQCGLVEYRHTHTLYTANKNEFIVF